MKTKNPKKAAPKRPVRKVVDDSPIETTEVSAEPIAQLPVEVRVKQALAVTPEYEKQLTQLRDKHADVKEITNADGFKQVDEARKELKRARVAIQAKGKAAREEAQRFAKAVIAEENRLIDIIEPEEDRLESLADDWEAEQARIERERREAEERRLQEIQERIATIRSWPTQAIGKSANDIEVLLNTATTYQVQLADFEHLTEMAELHLHESRATLRQLLEDRRQLEAEQAQAQKDREELARLRAEDEQRRRDAEVAALANSSPASSESLPSPGEGEKVTDTAPPGALVADRGTVVVEPVGVVPSSQVRVDDPIRPKDDEIIAAVSRAFNVRLQLAQQWIAEMTL